MKRWALHKQSVTWNRGGCPLLRAAMMKYGIDKFRFEVIIICFDESLHVMEREYIKRYNSITPGGYNILEGGQCGGGFKGKTHSAETVQKIKERLRFLYTDPALREKLAADARETTKSLDIGQLVKSSEKFKRAVSEGRVGYAGWYTSFTSDKKKEVYGKVSSSLKKYYETTGADKISFVNIDRHRAAMASAVGTKITSYIDGSQVKSYCSIADAARDIGVNKNALTRALKDPSRFTCRGMVWKFTPNCEDA
jgi:group I intron endonuclease